MERVFSTCSEADGGTSSFISEYATLEDDGTSIILDGPSQDADTTQLSHSLDFTTCVLEGLDVPAYVRSQMDSTNSLMGQQDADWTTQAIKYEVTWSYHPDNGFDVVIHETAQN
jgi:hypothetical protein